MKKALALLLAVAMLLGCASAVAEKVTLSVWSFTNELEGMINDWYKPTHPDVDIVYTLYPTDGGEYTSKVDSILASAPESAEAPDIFTLEAAFVKKYTNSDVTGDLKDIGFTDDDFATCIPAMLQIGQDNATGVQKGLAWQSTPGALLYRVDYAEKYLGITDPEAFQEKVADWDTFVETAAELNEKSEGAVKMFCAVGDIWNVYSYNRSQPWVVDGKLVIDDTLYDYLDMLKICEEDNLYAKGAAWTESWFAGMKEGVLCYLLPTWGLHYTIKPNCGGEKPGEGSYGLWKMVAGPCAYSWGGTWVGASAAKIAAADDAKKAAMKDFIEFFTLSEDFLYPYAKSSGDFVSNNAVVDKILAEGEQPNDFLGGQDHYAFFAQVASLANGAILTEYDETINSLFENQAVTPYIKGEKDLDTAIADFKAEVAAAISTITVE